MEIFPTLSVKPAISGFGHTALIDPVHRANFESGAALMRTRTRSIPIKYHINYPCMPSADKVILALWELENIGYGGLRFLWTNPDPDDGVTYISMLLSPINYITHPQSRGNFWIVTFDLATISIYELSPEN